MLEHRHLQALNFVIILHWIGCLWVFVGKSSGKYEYYQYFDGRRLNEALPYSNREFIEREGVDPRGGVGVEEAKKVRRFFITSGPA